MGKEGLEPSRVVAHMVLSHARPANSDTPPLVDDILPSLHAFGNPRPRPGAWDGLAGPDLH